MLTVDDNNQPLSSVQDFIDKWPMDKIAQIQDPVMRAVVVDLVNVMGQVEYEAEHAGIEAQKARSRATWGLLGGW